ncbi:hypothetical protein [Sansalvadorimonas verongulae]|uniref:hypothetical protein n=1 Tax=Sansalvadorimonas verongulae TaxID=2172824 RepID=UPI0012BC6C0A|nr:hypothetical protein [Sansalvadorimonas verongulae]MTI13439.1 hypothetical protein [Sansalvadorimonas verongulae]
MSKYLYATVYEEFTGLKPPEPTDNKQRRKRGYGHPYRMRLNMQEETETKQKKPERRNQFGQPINNSRKNRDEQPQKSRELPPQFNAMRNQREQRSGNDYEQRSEQRADFRSDKRNERREPRQKFSANHSPMGRAMDNRIDMMAMPAEPKPRQAANAPKVTYKKRRTFSMDNIDNSSGE